MSVGQKQFSLNGTYRIQGFVGQNLISRNLQRNSIRHAGGCCGKYPIGNIVSNGLTSTENINVVKMSTMNTSGLIETKYHNNCKCDNSHRIVKPDNNIHSNTQSSYIEILGTRCSYDDKNKTFKSIGSGCNVDPVCKYTKDITVNPRKASADQSLYLLRKKSRCSANNKFFIPHNWNGGPIYKGGGGITINPAIPNQEIPNQEITFFTAAIAIVPTYAVITFTPIPDYTYSIYNPPIGSQNYLFDGTFIIIGLNSDTDYTFTISSIDPQSPMMPIYSNTNQIRTPVGGTTDENGTVFALSNSTISNSAPNALIFTPYLSTVTYTLINPPLNSNVIIGYPPFSQGLIFVDNLDPETYYTFTLQETNPITNTNIRTITTNMITT